MGDNLRALTPLLLLGLALVVWLEPVIPGAEGLVRTFGDKAVLRFAVGLLCLFTLILMVERRQMQMAFEQIVVMLRQSRGNGAGQAAGGAEGAVDPAEQEKMRRDALGILVAALESEDHEVRARAAENLERMTGQKFGEDASRWKKHLGGLSDSP